MREQENPLINKLGSAMRVLGRYPQRRMRRMRRDDFSRRLMREHQLTASDLIYPVFVTEGSRRNEPVPSMPGIYRYSLDRLLPHIEQCAKAAIPAVAIFPAIERKLKTADGREAINPRGLVPRVVAALKKNFPAVGLITDA